MVLLTKNCWPRIVCSVPKRDDASPLFHPSSCTTPYSSPSFYEKRETCYSHISLLARRRPFRQSSSFASLELQSFTFAGIVVVVVVANVLLACAPSPLSPSPTCRYTYHARKVTDKVDIPLVLDLSPFMPGGKGQRQTIMRHALSVLGYHIQLV